jgi:hypothetical protein
MERNSTRGRYVKVLKVSPRTAPNSRRSLWPLLEKKTNRTTVAIHARSHFILCRDTCGVVSNFNSVRSSCGRDNARSTTLVGSGTRMKRLGINGIVDTLQAHFAVISEDFAFGVSKNTTKYVNIVRMMSSIPSLSG